MKTEIHLHPKELIFADVFLDMNDHDSIERITNAQHIFLYSFDPRLILAVGFFCFCIDWYLKSIALHLIL